MVIIQEYAQNGTKLRRCDARCYNAKGKKCFCICGAINHGKGIYFTVENAMNTLINFQETSTNTLFHLGEEVYFMLQAGKLFKSKYPFI